eukprot:1014539-Pleurochrysis_carterae.AAC.1
MHTSRGKADKSNDRTLHVACIVEQTACLAVSAYLVSAIHALVARFTNSHSLQMAARVADVQPAEQASAPGPRASRAR